MQTKPWKPVSIKYNQRVKFIFTTHIHFEIETDLALHTDFPAKKVHKINTKILKSIWFILQEKISNDQPCIHLNMSVLFS